MKPNEYSKKFEEVYNTIVTKSTNPTELNSNLELLYNLIVNFQQDSPNFASAEDVSRLKADYENKVREMEFKVTDKETKLNSVSVENSQLKSDKESMKTEHDREVKGLKNKINNQLSTINNLEKQIEELNASKGSDDCEVTLANMEESVSLDVITELRKLTDSVDTVATNLKVLTNNNQDMYLTVNSSKTLIERLINVTNKCILVIEGYRHDTKKYTKRAEECVDEFNKVKSSADFASENLTRLTEECIEMQDMVNVNTSEVEGYKEEVSRMKDQLKPVLSFYHKIQGMFK